MSSVPLRLRPPMRLFLIFCLCTGIGFLPNLAHAESQQETSAGAESEADSSSEDSPSEKDSSAKEEEQPASSEVSPSETTAASVQANSVAQSSIKQQASKQLAQPEPAPSPAATKPLTVEPKNSLVTKALVTKVEEPSKEKSPDAKGKLPTQLPAIANALPESKRLIGAVAFVMENQSQLIFRARVDTGAKSCSIHTEEVRIEDPAETMEANVGKAVRIKLKNDREESEWVETSISRIVRVKTSEQAEERYCVSLVLVYEGLEKEVRVTLNDRSHMVYPLLLGRNFLQGDFLVDVDVPAPK